MGIKRNYIHGEPSIEHISSPPRVYLDNWAIDLVTKIYKDQFVKLLNSKRGTLCVSFFNIVEIIDYRNEENKKNILNFIDNVDSVLINVDPVSVESNKTWYETDFIKKCEPLLKPLSVLNLAAIIRQIDKEFSENNAQVKKSFEDKIYPMIIKARADEKVLAASKTRKKHKNYCGRNKKASVSQVFQACADYIVANETMKMDDGEWIDTFHTVVPVCCCNFVLIDRRWTQFLLDVGLEYPQIAKVYDKNGIEKFLSDLEIFDY